MNESQVTIDGHPHALPRPFMVIATQNPVEHHGTYPLPESQLDRFLMRLRIGYPDSASEREIVRNSERELPQTACVRCLRATISCGCRTRCSAWRWRKSLVDYMLAIVEKTRASRIADAGRQPARLAGAVPRGAGAGAARRPRIRHSGRREAPGGAGLRPSRGGQYAHGAGRSGAPTLGERIIEEILSQMEVPL